MLLERILMYYNHVYLFDADSVCKKTRDKSGNFSDTRYNCTLDTCDCPAGQHGVECRHRKMRLQTFASKKMINPKKLLEVVQKYERITFGAVVTHTVEGKCTHVVASRPCGDSPVQIAVAIENNLPLYWIFK